MWKFTDKEISEIKINSVPKNTKACVKILKQFSGSRKNPRGFLSRSTENSDFLKIKKIHAARKMDVSADDKLGFFLHGLTVDFTKLWPRQLRGWLGIWEL